MYSPRAIKGICLKIYLFILKAERSKGSVVLKVR